MFFDFLPRRQQALRPAAHVLFFLRARKAEKEMRLLAVAQAVSTKEVAERAAQLGRKGAEIGAMVHEARCHAVAQEMKAAQ